MTSQHKPPAPQVLVYRHPNLEIRSYLTPKEISSYRVECFNRATLDRDADALRSLGSIGEQAVRDLMGLFGVEEIHIKPRELRIKKALAASWDLLEPQIIGILQRAVRRKQIVRVK